MKDQGVVNLRGKRYATVALRTHQFRKECPVSDGWGIATTVDVDDLGVLAKATITDGQGRLIAQGHAYQKMKASGRSAESTNPIEVAETSAVGRALAFAGYPGDADMGIASADEVIAAQQQQAAAEPEPMKMGRQSTIRTLIGDLADALGRDIPDFDAKAFDAASKLTGRTITGWGEMSDADATSLISAFQAQLAKATSTKDSTS